MTVGRVPLTLAISGYHHTDDLTSGAVAVEGVDLTALILPVEEIFFRFTKFREWGVSEMSFGKYTALRSRGDRSLIALPVFPSRVFRHSSIYVRTQGPRAAEDLVGATVGLPEWAQTAAVYSRGLLTEDFGLKLDEISWVQAGLNQAGREEKVSVDLPPGVQLTRVADRSLNEMLLAGDLDAILTAHAPESFEAGSPKVRRLFPDYRKLEREYAARTGIFPIMHVIVLRGDLYEQHPWLAANLVTAFEESKARSLARITEITASRLPLPWSAQTLADVNAELFGGDHWPYGVEANRPTLEYFCRQAHRQGVAAREMAPEELFAPETLATYRI